MKREVTIEREPLRVKTHKRFTVAPDLMVGADPIKGDRILITGGAFKGMAGKAVDFDGEWITVEQAKTEPGSVTP